VNSFFSTETLSICLTSLKTSSVAIVAASLLGVPVALWASCHHFAGRGALVTAFNTLTALPSVFVGVLLYSLLSRSGPLGSLELLYTWQAMTIGQTLLALPLIVSLTLAALSRTDLRLRKELITLGIPTWRMGWILVKEARFGVLAAVVAAFGRVFTEVGSALMLGGNIRHATRTITTSIAMETSKGNFELGLGLGFLLLAVALTINIGFHRLQETRAQ